jgi:hypothetical protein
MTERRGRFLPRPRDRPGLTRLVSGRIGLLGMLARRVSPNPRGLVCAYQLSNFSSPRMSTILSLNGSLFRAVKSLAVFIEVNQRVHLSTTVFFVDQVTEAMPWMPEMIGKLGMLEELQSRTELLRWFPKVSSWARRTVNCPLQSYQASRLRSKEISTSKLCTFR